MSEPFKKDLQFYKFCSYGFLKNLRFFEPFLMLFFLEKGLSYFEIGILYSIREITVNIIEIPTGVLADAFGRRRTMVFSFLSYIAAFLVFNFSSFFPLFIAAMICFSFGEAFRTGTHKAMIFEYLKINGWADQKVHYYGNTRAASQIGSAVSAVIASMIVFYTGTMKVVFLYSTIPYFLDLLLMISYPKELEGPTGKLVVSEISSSVKKVFASFFKAARDPVFLTTLANISVPKGFHKAVKDYLQPVIILFAVSFPLFADLDQDKRISVMIGFFYTVIYIFNSAASKNAGNIAEKFTHLCKPLNLSLFAAFIAGIIIGVTYNADLPVIAITGFLVIYLLENLRRPIGVSYMSEIIDDSIMATVLSTDSQVSAVTASIIALLIGFLADRIGLGYAIVSASVLLLVVSVFIRLPDNKCKSSKITE